MTLQETMENEFSKLRKTSHIFHIISCYTEYDRTVRGGGREIYEKKKIVFQDTVTEYSDDDGHGGAGISEDEGGHTKVFSSAITGRSKCNDKVVT